MFSIGGLTAEHPLAYTSLFYNLSVRPIFNFLYIILRLLPIRLLMLSFFPEAIPLSNNPL